MSTDSDPSTGLLTMLAAGVGLCCGLPLLLGAGLTIGASVPRVLSMTKPLRKPNVQQRSPDGQTGTT